MTTKKKENTERKEKKVQLQDLDFLAFCMVHGANSLLALRGSWPALFNLTENDGK